MNIHIPQLLTEEELNSIHALIKNENFEDGKKTANMAAQSVKDNEQLNAKNDNTNKIGQIIENAIQTSPLLNQAFLPYKIYKPIISRYTEGMQYGWHTDAALMGKEKLRTDIAMTLFINEPPEYDGGELILQTSIGQIPYKMAAGDAIVYPATQLHCVNKVTRGERLVAVTWMQSQIRSTEQRELLFQMTQVIAAMNQKGNNTVELDMIMQCYSNLQRMWAEN